MIFSVLALVVIIAMAMLTFFVIATQRFDEPHNGLATQWVGFVCIFIAVILFIINLSFLSLTSER